jgi:hypothetical protein
VVFIFIDMCLKHIFLWKLLKILNLILGKFKDRFRMYLLLVLILSVQVYCGNYAVESSFSTAFSGREFVFLCLRIIG